MRMAKVGQAFEAVKNNGKDYAGEVVKVATYPRGTLVTIRFYTLQGYTDSDGNDRYGHAPVYKSVYLEECERWTTSDGSDD